MVYLKPYLESKGNHHLKKITFQTKGDAFLCFVHFQNRKRHFHYVLRGPLQKMEALDKSLSCFTVAGMFLNPGVFFFFFNLKLC